MAWLEEDWDGVPWFWLTLNAVFEVGFDGRFVLCMRFEDSTESGVSVGL